MEKELMRLHGKLTKHGFRFRPQNIIGARPTSGTARNDHTSPIVMKAAKSADLWNIRVKDEKGRLAYFKDVPSPRRHVQVKRKRQETSDEKESKPKRSRTEQNPEPKSAAKNREGEEAKEEKMQQKFVAKELKKEEHDAETAFIARQIQEELEDAEAENSLPEGERLRRAVKRQNMVNEIDINDFLREQRNQTRMAVADDELSQENVREDQEGSPNQSDIEYEYVT
jgi:hypothetical protein